MIDATRRIEYITDAPYTYGYYTKWTEDMCWVEDKVKLYAPKNSKGQYVTDPIEIYDFLEKNEKNDTSYYEASYNPYSDEIYSFMTPFTYERWFELGENDKVFHTDLTVTIVMPQFGKDTNMPYNIGIYKNAGHAPNDQYYEYLEEYYKPFLDYFFDKMFAADSDEFKDVFKSILNNANGTKLIEESYVFNSRKVDIVSRSGISVYISDIIK